MKKINNLFAFITIVAVMSVFSSLCFAQTYQSRTGIFSFKEDISNDSHYISDFSINSEEGALILNNSTRDSLNMDFLGKALYGEAISVFINGSIAYVGTTTSLMIFDISNPIEPLLIGHWHHSYSRLNSIHVAGNYAYLALSYSMPGGSEGAIGIVDISNPADPVEVACFQTSSSSYPDVYDVYTQGNYCYAVYGTELLILDVSNPANPVQIGVLDFGGMPNFTNSVEVIGNYAYVAATAGGFNIVDVSDPANPTIVGTYPTPVWVRQVKVIGNYAYLLSSFGGSSLFEVVDIIDPTNPIFVGSISLSDVGRMYINGSYAYIGIQETPSPTGLTGGLDIIDISDPTDLSIVSSCEIEGGAWIVSVANNFCYVAAKGGGLIVIDVSQPNNPIPVSWYNIGQLAYSVDVIDNYAYVADRNALWPNKGSLRIVDVTNASSPVELAVFETGGEVRTVSVEYPYAYIADGYNGLSIADISNPNSITGVGSYQQADMYVNDVDIANQYAYIACNDNLKVLDISDPATPVLVGELVLSVARSVFLTDNFAFVSTISGSGSEKGMHIVDISNPTNPFVLGSFASTGQSGTLQTYVLNDLAYLADSQGGLRIVDISDPTNPVEVGNYLTSGIAASIFVSGSYAYVGIISNMGSIAGVEIINVSDLSNLNLAGYYTLFDQGYDVFVTDDIVYVASGRDGLNILEFTGGVEIDESIPVEYILKQNYPNPFNPATTISFYVTQTSQFVTLEIFNIKGQRVKTLIEERLEVGSHQVIWDGKDENSKLVSSGVYFYKMISGEYSSIKKMILMK